MSAFSNLIAQIWPILNYPLLSLGKTTISLWSILINIFLIIIFILISSRIRNWLLISVAKKKGADASNWRTVITLSYYIIIVMGLVVILQTTGIDLSFFTVLTGAIGIGLGFGMQTIFSNFISGIIILLEKPIKLGDRIEVGNVSGNVDNISVRATTIITNDNVSIIVPNSDFITKQVINWSHSGNTVRISISVNVSYDSDPELVKDLLLQVAKDEEGVLKAPVPVVQLTEFGENGLNFSLLVWTEKYFDRKGVLKSLLNFSVLKSFKASGIKIPFPQSEIRLLNEKFVDKLHENKS